MNDQISRQKLIEDIEREFDGVCTYDVSPSQAVSDFIEIVDRQPPEECVPLSEVYRVIAGHSNYHGDNILAALTCVAVGKEVKPVRPLPADQWIPVTYRETTEEERECGIEWGTILDCPLPDNDTEILVCTKAGSVWTDTFFNDDGCYLDGGYDLTEIAAWMPLPEAYKGE